MIYSDFQELKLSRLGFGTMRLPKKEDQSIDREKTEEMVAYALSHGINYFDTAYPYHDGFSERVIGDILKQYPRESFYLATKYPGHQTPFRRPEEVFEEQLKKCQVEYFDFYLLHNVNEMSVKTYMDDSLGILDYFVEQKRLGRIRHLGFSNHSTPETLEKFLNYAGDRVEFCQIQLNYLDWSLQDAARKYEIIKNHGLPVWVMEPVRGGKLAQLPPSETASLRALRRDESTAAWCFRFLQTLPQVKMVLSGMSSLEQMQDNIRTFEEEKPLNREETALLFAIADRLKNAVPCTGCRYCTAGCPMLLDIPRLIRLYNDYRVQPALMTRLQLDALGEAQSPVNCIGCGACSRACPQNIDIPAEFKKFSAMLAENPSWAEVCRRREARAAELAQKEHKD